MTARSRQQPQPWYMLSLDDHMEVFSRHERLAVAQLSKSQSQQVEPSYMSPRKNGPTRGFDDLQTPTKHIPPSPMVPMDSTAVKSNIVQNEGGSKTNDQQQTPRTPTSNNQNDHTPQKAPQSTIKPSVNMSSSQKISANSNSDVVTPSKADHARSSKKPSVSQIMQVSMQGGSVGPHSRHSQPDDEFHNSSPVYFCPFSQQCDVIKDVAVSPIATSRYVKQKALLEAIRSRKMKMKEKLAVAAHRSSLVSPCQSSKKKDATSATSPFGFGSAISTKRSPPLKSSTSSQSQNSPIPSTSSSTSTSTPTPTPAQVLTSLPTTTVPATPPPTDSGYDVHQSPEFTSGSITMSAPATPMSPVSIRSRTPSASTTKTAYPRITEIQHEISMVEKAIEEKQRELAYANYQLQLCRELSASRQEEARLTKYEGLLLYEEANALLEELMEKGKQIDPRINELQGRLKSTRRASLNTYATIMKTKAEYTYKPTVKTENYQQCLRLLALYDSKQRTKYKLRRGLLRLGRVYTMWKEKMKGKGVKKTKGHRHHKYDHEASKSLMEMLITENRHCPHAHVLSHIHANESDDDMLKATNEDNRHSFSD